MTVCKVERGGVPIGSDKESVLDVCGRPEMYRPIWRPSSAAVEGSIATSTRTLAGPKEE